MISRKALLLFFLQVFSFWHIGAQELSLRVRRFEDVPELANLFISSVMQDRTGFIWIGTESGLVRYDGNTFKVFRHKEGDTTSLYSNFVFNIAEDANGDIWVALFRGGVSRYDRRTGRFQNFPFTQKLDPSTVNTLAVFSDKDGQVWASVREKGLVRINPQRGEIQQFDIFTAKNAPQMKPSELMASNQAYQFWQDPTDGKIWLTTNYGFFILDPKTGHSEPFLQPDSLFDAKLGMGLWGILHDGDLFWSGSWLFGLKRINRKTGEIRNFLYKNVSTLDPITNVINGIVPKNEDELWCTTIDRGLVIFNKKTEQFRFLDESDERLAPLSKGQSMTALFQDRQGNLWILSNGILIQVLIENRLLVSKKLENIPEIANISCMNEDKEGRFFITGLRAADGFRLLEKKTGRTVSLNFKNIPKVENYTVCQYAQQSPSGKIWLLSWHNFFQLDPVRLQLVMPPQAPIISTDGRTNYYTRFGVDSLDRLWIGTSDAGLLCVDTRTNGFKQFLPDENDPNSIPARVVGSVAVDVRGRCWYGSRDKTCYGYYLELENRFVRLDENGQETLNRVSQATNHIISDQLGRVWVCSENGLLLFDCRGERPVFVKKFTMADGLPSDNALYISVDHEGILWGTARNSLFRLDPQTARVRVFGRKEGFDFVSLGYVYCSIDSMIYVFGGSRYVKIDPKKLQPLRFAPRLALTSFKVNDQEQYQGSELLPDDVLLVPSDSRHFSLQVAALDFAIPESHEYEYFFEGFDDHWVKSGTRNVFNFTNIPAGRYTFKVKLAGAPDEEAISLPIRVEVAFYKTNWFWMLVLAIALGAIWRYVQIRNLQKQQLQELQSKTQSLEKEKAVVMYESLKQQLNPHFLFNSLTSLGSLIQIDAREAVGFLDNLSKTYRYILKSSEHELVPLAEELRFVDSFIKLQKTRFPVGFEIKFDIPEEYHHRKIVPVTLQNLLENAIKHNIIDEETPLVVEVFIADDCLTMRNNLQRKRFVETSNRKGLAQLRSFYKYLSHREIEIIEDQAFFTIKIPLV